MEKKYNALRIIVTLMKILAILVAILTVVAVCGLLGAGASLGSEIDRLTQSLGQGPTGWGSLAGLLGSILASILPVIVGGFIALLLYAGAEFITVQIDIESNTRSLGSYLSSLNLRPAPAPVPLPRPVVNPAIDRTNLTPSIKQRSFCPQCGAKVEPSTEKCPQCGYIFQQVQNM